MFFLDQLAGKLEKSCQCAFFSILISSRHSGGQERPKRHFLRWKQAENKAEAPVDDTPVDALAPGTPRATPESRGRPLARPRLRRPRRRRPGGDRSRSSAAVASRGTAARVPGDLGELDRAAALPRRPCARGTRPAPQETRARPIARPRRRRARGTAPRAATAPGGPARGRRRDSTLAWTRRSRGGDASDARGRTPSWTRRPP